MQFKSYLIYSKNLDMEVDNEELPGEFSLLVISTIAEYHFAIESGYDFSSYPKNENIEFALRKGAWLLCLFQERSLAHTTWLAHDHSQAVYDSLFFAGRIGVSRDAYIGPCNTYSPFRGRGLYPIALKLACQNLKRRGAGRAFINTKQTNIASIRGIRKAYFSKCGKAFVISLLGRRFTHFEALKNINRII